MEDNKYKYAREIIFDLRVCQAISPEVYLHWIDKIDNEEELKSPEAVSGSFTDSDIAKEFEIVGNSNDHDFKMGEVVTLSEKREICIGRERRFDSKQDYWFCLPEDVRKL
jgi:hypothetical protein